MRYRGMGVRRDVPMRLLCLPVLAVCAACSACAPTGTADPAPVLASQGDLARIRQAIAPCLRKAWLPRAKGKAARVTLKWRLDEDGRLVGEPEVIDPPDTNVWSSSTAEAAVRAVRACEPFRLPVARYHLWKEIVFNFDAVSMSR